MAHLVYKQSTMRCLTERNGSKYFATERAAKAALTRAVNKGKVTDRSEWKIGTPEQFAADDREIEVISAFDGKTKCKIQLSDKGSVCDPSTERYWSM